MKAAVRASRSISTYGGASAIFSGVIACALVMGASIFGKELATLIGDVRCAASPGCTMPITGAAPLPNDSAEQLSAELPALHQPPAALPATAMQTTTR